MTAEAANPNPSQAIEKPTEAPESRWTTLQRSIHFPSRQMSVRSNFPSRVSRIIKLHAHAPQCGDSLFNGRVRTENLGNKFPRLVCSERIRDEKVRGRVIRAAHRCGIRGDFLQRGGKTVGVSGEERA